MGAPGGSDDCDVMTWGGTDRPFSPTAFSELGVEGADLEPRHGIA